MSKRKNEFSLTQKEMDVMEILWQSNKPLVASEITKINESLNINTVQAVIRKLLDKKIIKVSDIVYSGTVLTRSYLPVLSKNELMTQQLLSQFQKDGDKVTIPNLVTTLLKHEKNEKEVIEQLEILLKERKKSLNQEEK
ncbi:BlaI/MecI/CopY family transcriptional regulator [Anaerocolumna sp.]|uniref:BlaI/MecI/CopY family transcriptional regulator n=1 Tax=Anaerocolumna sp. TaxID=2041569 RepID=UPI0028AFE081|nr:BlaI/MecI/CopY family transcriptional regulator [Anaerocolumna sp.]